MFDYVFLELEDHRQDPFNFQKFQTTKNYEKMPLKYSSIEFHILYKIVLIL